MHHNGKVFEAFYLPVLIDFKISVHNKIPFTDIGTQCAIIKKSQMAYRMLISLSFSYTILSILKNQSKYNLTPISIKIHIRIL